MQTHERCADSEQWKYSRIKMETMDNSYKFFENKQCQYYPCHKGTEQINCLFCYCPLYSMEKCPGCNEYKEIKGKRVKVCMNCTFPHIPENYDRIIELLKQSQS